MSEEGFIYSLKYSHLEKGFPAEDEYMSSNYYGYRAWILEKEKDLIRYISIDWTFYFYMESDMLLFKLKYPNYV